MKKRMSILLLTVIATLSFTSCAGGGSATKAPATPAPVQPATTAPAVTPASAAPQTSKTPEKAPEKTTVRFFHRWPMEPRNSYFNSVVKSFQEKNPNVTIEMDSVENDAYKEKIRVLVSSDNIPDVFTSWSDTFASNLVKSGRIKELDTMIAQDKEWSSKIIASQFKNFTVDNKVYGIPLTIDGKVFVYNKEAFEKLGLQEPKTFNELVAVLDKLKANYNEPLIEGLSNAWTISHYLGTMFQRLVDPAVIAQDYNIKTSTYTDPGYKTGLDSFQKLVSYMGPNATSITHTDARNAFIAGKHAMIYVQFAEFGYIHKDAAFKFGYFNFPSFENGKGDASQLTGAPEGFMLSKTSKDNVAKASEQLLKYMTTYEQAEKFVKDCGAPVAIVGAVNEKTAFTEMIGAVDIINKASGSWPWFDNAVDINIADAFMKGSQSVAAKDSTNEQVLKDVQKAAQELKAK